MMTMVRPLMPSAGTSSFTQYDSSLQDSDQTITDLRRARYGRRRRIGDTRWTDITIARKGASTFFPDSTDDEQRPDKNKQLSLQGINVNQERAVVSKEMPAMYIGDIQFPLTRSILWDRRPFTSAFVLCIQDVLPSRIVILNEVVKKMFALYKDSHLLTDKNHQLSPKVLCTVGAEHGRDCVTVTSFHEARNSRNPQLQNSPDMWKIPVMICGERKDAANEQIHKSNLDSLQSKLKRMSGDGIVSSSGSSLLEGSLMISKPSTFGEAELQIEYVGIVLDVSLAVTLIRSLPLLLTPLALSLSRRELGVACRCGYLTLDKARKAVPLLPSDPLVHQRPIVGIWVYGIDPLNEDNGPETNKNHQIGFQLEHPFLYESCIRYILAENRFERAQVDSNTFLVAVYVGRDQASSDPLPRFFECCYKETDQQSLLSWNPCMAQTRCLPGVSSFKIDVEMQLVVPQHAVPTAGKTVQPEGLVKTSACGQKEDLHQHHLSPFLSSPAYSGGIHETITTGLKPVDTKPNQIGVWKYGSYIQGENGPSSPRPPFNRGATVQEHNEVGMALPDTNDNRFTTSTSPSIERISSSVKSGSSVKTSTNTPLNRSRQVTAEEHTKGKIVNCAQYQNEQRTHFNCCQSQHEIVLQHQQLLDSQQRQLSELQQQICQLQQLLTETREENARLISESISLRNSSNSSDSASRHNNGQHDDLPAKDRLKTSDLVVVTDKIPIVQNERATSDELNQSRASSFHSSNDSSLRLSAMSSPSELLSSYSSRGGNVQVGVECDDQFDDVGVEEAVCYEIEAVINGENCGRREKHSCVASYEPLSNSQQEDVEDIVVDQDKQLPQQAKQSMSILGTSVKSSSSLPSTGDDENDSVENENTHKFERLVIPSAPDHLTVETPCPVTNNDSFFIPRIRYIAAESQGSDSEEDGIRTIELKYTKQWMR